MKHDLNNMMIGTAGELRVMSELILNGFNPAKSYLDDGVDIILSNGARIQVKTAMYKQKMVHGGRCYRFQLRKSDRKKRAKISAYSDFLIGYIIPETAFFVIPTNVIDTFTCLSFTMNKNMKSKYSKYLNNWNLLKR